jgi:hypothetical protein
LVRSEGDDGHDERAAARGAVDPKPAVEDGKPVTNLQETASIRLRAADAVVAYLGAPPTPSSHISTCSELPSTRVVTSVRCTWACFAMLVSASATTT